MESETNPPTPASGVMQVEHDPPPPGPPPPSSSSSSMHKSESTTMLCDDQHDAAAGGGAGKPAEVTTMVCDDGKSADMTVKDLLLLCQLFYLPAAHGRVRGMGPRGSLAPSWFFVCLFD